MDTLLPIISHWKAAMVIVEGWPEYMPLLDALGFTVDTVYYGVINLKYPLFYPELSSWAPVSSSSNRQ